MKFKHLAVTASAAAGLFVASQAMAIAPGDARFGAPDFTFYLSGASATSKTMPKVLEQFCSLTPGDLTVYVDDPASGSDGKKWKAVYCIMDGSAPAPLAGAEVLWVERFKGGSGWGPYPVDNNYYVEELNIFRDGSGAPVCANTDADADVECSWEADRIAGLVGDECDLGPGAAGGDVLASDPAASTLCVVPHGGVADEEAAVFADGAPSIPASFPPQASFSNLTQKQGFGVVFQPVVTEDVYRHLQQSQGTHVYADPSDEAGESTNWTLAAQPSLTRAQIRTILRVGNIDRWGTGTTGLLNEATTIGTSNLGLMGICRRVAGSGTQAAYHIYFLDDPCGKNSLQNGAQPFRTAGDSVGFIQIVENSSSGDVMDCMDAMYNPAEHGAGFPGIVAARGGIGVQSVEKQPDHSVPYADPLYDHWGFIKVNGNRPSEVDTAQSDNITVDGSYDFFFENSIMWNSVTCTGDCATAMSFLAANAGTDETLATAFGAPKGTFAIDGVGPAGNVNDWTDVAAVYPISRATREGNSCKGVVLR